MDDPHWGYGYPDAREGVPKGKKALGVSLETEPRSLDTPGSNSLSDFVVGSDEEDQGPPYQDDPEYQDVKGWLRKGHMRSGTFDRLVQAQREYDQAHRDRSRAQRMEAQAPPAEPEEEDWKFVTHRRRRNPDLESSTSGSSKGRGVPHKKGDKTKPRKVDERKGGHPARGDRGHSEEKPHRKLVRKAEASPKRSSDGGSSGKGSKNSSDKGSQVSMSDLRSAQSNGRGLTQQLRDFARMWQSLPSECKRRFEGKPGEDYLGFMEKFWQTADFCGLDDQDLARALANLLVDNANNFFRRLTPNRVPASFWPRR
jgi:hypothetical protein